MGVSGVLRLLRSVDRLLSLEVKHGKAIEDLERDMASLTGRVISLEAREGIVIAEAKAAAGAAATQVAIVSVSDISRRIGRLEERSDAKRLTEE